MSKTVISIKYEGQSSGYLSMEETDGKGVLYLDSTLPDAPSTDTDNCKLHITIICRPKAQCILCLVMRWINVHCFMFAVDCFDMEDIGTWGYAMGKYFKQFRFRSHVHDTKYITGYGMSYLVKGEVCRNIAVI